MKSTQLRLQRLEPDGALAIQPGDEAGASLDVSDANFVTRINQLQTRTLSILQRADAAGRADVGLKAFARLEAI